jgi:hypothetical protein
MWSEKQVVAAPPGPWIHSRAWDSLFLFASVLLVAVPFATYYTTMWLSGAPPQAFQHSQALGVAMLINLGAAFFIGGPHMYATYTMTLAERRFRSRHPYLLRAAAAVPILVMVLSLTRIELLMFLFFGWASVHVVHQLIFLVSQYQLRVQPEPLPLWSRAIDYVVVISCLYPIALWRLLAPEGSVLQLPLGVEIVPGFFIGRADISRLVPDLIHGQMWIVTAVSVIFATAWILFLLRTGREIINRSVVWPRVILIALTAPVAFIVPAFDNLDVALQGLNLWHSAQYIGLVYLMNAYRHDRHEISSPLVEWISGIGHGLRYYAFIVTVSLGAGGLIGVLHFGFGLPMLQAYYAVLMSGLWIHYLWDHAVFTQRDALTPLAIRASTS